MAGALLHWQVVGRWTRLYSEVHLIELKTTATTRRLIAKRAVRQPANAKYFGRGDVARRELQALQQAEDAVAIVPNCNVPRAYGIVAGDDWLLMEYVSGAELDRQLVGARWLTTRDRQRGAERHFERLGTWLQAYQRASSTALDVTVLDETLDQCQRRLVDLVATSSISADVSLHIIARLQDLHRQIDKTIEGSQCHGDFGPWNVLVCENQLTVIDFFCHHLDSIWIDPLNVVTYLQTQRPSVTLSRRRVEGLRDAFLHGYGRRLEMARPELRLCLAYQQICRLQDTVSLSTGTWADRYRCRKVVRELVRELAGDKDNTLALAVADS